MSEKTSVEMLLIITVVSSGHICVVQAPVDSSFSDAYFL